MYETISLYVNLKVYLPVDKLAIKTHATFSRMICDETALDVMTH